MPSPFHDRLFDVPLPPLPAGEPAPGALPLTRRAMFRFMTAGAAAAMFPAAHAAACSVGAFAHEILLVSLSFFPGGATLVTAGLDGFVKFWTVPDAALFRTIATTQVPYSLAVSPDGQWIAVGMVAGVLELWSSDGSNKRSLTGHLATVDAVAFTPNSQQLVSASPDLTTKVWSVADATLQQSFTVNTDAMTQVSVPSQGRFLMSAGSQLYMRLLATGAAVQNAPGTILALSPDGELLAAHDGQSLYLRSFPSLDLIASVSEPITATALGFSGDGRFIAASYGGAGSKLYSAPGLQLVSSLGPSTGLSLSLDMDSTGRYLAIASGKNIQLYALPSGNAVPVCFMDVAASASTASGSEYTRKGVNYTVACGASLPAGAVCTCNCVPGACSCVQENGCTCVSDTGCSCVDDTSCPCVYNNCVCVNDLGCYCVSDTGCGCVTDFGCGCVTDYGCGCVADCGCVGDVG